VRQAQGAALCHYLLQSNGGAYRVRFAGIVRKYLSGDASEEDLPKALGKSFEEIEKELAAFMAERLAS
jgi:hypothetical protein